MREYWLCKYIISHSKQLGLKALEGPFDNGPDFKAKYRGQDVSIEAETQYRNYIQHGHPKNWADVLIVATIDPVPEKYKEILPPIIINIDLQKVLDWSLPLRTQYWQEWEKKRNEWEKRDREIISKFPPEIQGYLSSNGVMQPEKLEEYCSKLQAYPSRRLASELATLYNYYVREVYKEECIRHYRLDRETGWATLEEIDEEDWVYWNIIAIAVTTEFNIHLSIWTNNWINGSFKRLIKHGLSEAELKELEPLVNFIDGIDPISDNSE